MQKALKINKASIDAFVNKYPNLKAQIDLGSKLMGNQQVCLFIETTNGKYFPASLEIDKFNQYLITPLFILHGVGSSKPFEDIKNIADSGFKALSAFSWFPDKHLDNLYILDYNPFSKESFEVKYEFTKEGIESTSEDTYGDSYYLQMHLLNKNGPIPLPKNFAHYFNHGIRSCNTENLSITIILNPNLTQIQEKERKKFYRHELKHPQIKLVKGSFEKSNLLKIGNIDLRILY